MGNIIDYSVDIKKEIESTLKETGEETLDSFFKELDSEYSKYSDYKKGEVYLYVFYPDFEQSESFSPIIMASCLQEAIDLFNAESEEAFSLDDWGIIKYPLLRGLII